MVLRCDPPGVTLVNRKAYLRSPNRLCVSQKGKVFLMSVVAKIRAGVKQDASAEFAIGTCAFEEERPGIWEFVARQSYQGNPRATGKVVIFVEGGKATLCLIDRGSGQVAFFTAETLSEAILGTEEALQAGSLDWRLDKKAAMRR